MDEPTNMLGLPACLTGSSDDSPRTPPLSIGGGGHWRKSIARTVPLSLCLLKLHMSQRGSSDFSLAIAASRDRGRLRERMTALDDLRDRGALDHIDFETVDLEFGRLIRAARDGHTSDEHALTEEYLLLEQASIIADEVRGRMPGIGSVPAAVTDKSNVCPGWMTSTHEKCMAIAYVVGRGLCALGAAEIGKDARPHVDWAEDGDGLRVLRKVGTEIIQQEHVLREDNKTTMSHLLPSMAAVCSVFYARAALLHSQWAQHAETRLELQDATKTAEKSIESATQWTIDWMDFDADECLLLLGGPEGSVSSAVRSEWIRNCQVPNIWAPCGRPRALHVCVRGQLEIAVASAGLMLQVNQCDAAMAVLLDSVHVMQQIDFTTCGPYTRNMVVYFLRALADAGRIMPTRLEQVCACVVDVLHVLAAGFADKAEVSYTYVIVSIFS